MIWCRGLRFAFWLTLALQVSCGGGSKPGAAEDVAFGAVDFQTIRNEVLEPSCLSCHGEYGTYRTVYLRRQAILAEVEADRMPKVGGPLSDSLKRLLRDWIVAGAPETVGGGPNQEIEPLPLVPSWVSLSEHLFTPKCAVCHNPEGQARFLDLSSEEAFRRESIREFGGVPLIDVQNPDGSYLLQVLHDDEEPMPPVWSGISRPEAQVLEVLRQWIAQGLP